MRRRWQCADVALIGKAIGLLVILAASTAGHASGRTTIDAPPPRLVSPGDYVTLVFTVHPGASGTAGLEFAPPPGWQLLGARDAASVAAGQPLPLAVTLAVPTSADPTVAYAMRLAVNLQGSVVSASVVLHVSPRPGVGLEAPPEVPLEAGSVRATIANTGNVDLHLDVAFDRGSQTLATETLEVRPQATRSISFPVSKGGAYVIQVARNGSVVVSRSVTVLAYGVPTPSPFRVHTRVQGSVASDGTWGVVVTGAGRLSDYTEFSARLSDPSPSTSFVQLDTGRWSARIGSSLTAPHGLVLPSALGVSASVHGSAWDAFGSGGHVQGDQWAGYLGAAWLDRTDHVTLAAGAGMASGSPAASFSVRQRLKKKRMSAVVSLSNGHVYATGEANVSRDGARLHLEANAGTDAAGNTLAGASVDYRAGSTRFYAAGTVNPSTVEVETARAGFSTAVPLGRFGGLGVSSQAGTDTSFVLLQKGVDLGTWQGTSSAGVVWDQYGSALSIDTSWQLPGDDYLGFDGGLRIGLGNAQDTANLGVRGQASIGPVLVYGGAEADGTAHSASARAGAQVRAGPFTTDISGAVSSPYADFGSQVSVSFQLRGSYDFPVDVPGWLSAAAGGRRVGTLDGMVMGAAGVPGVVVDVGPYRLHVTSAGTFQAKLAPGTYDVHLDLTTVPIDYRLSGPTHASVSITAKQTTRVAFKIEPGAGVKGRLLLDTSGDGTPDQPPVGVKATVSLVDAQGLLHVADTGSNGAFAFRNLPAGGATLSVSGLGLGHELEGPAERTVTVKPGKVDDVTIVVEPSVAAAQVFGASTLRIRSAAVEADRVPPGSAPLVEVALSGPADSVRIVTASRTVELEGSGESWTGRVPIPADAPNGVFRFEVSATRGGHAAKRPGRVIVDRNAAMVTARATTTMVPGKYVGVEATVLADADRVAVTSVVGVSGQLKESSPGHWSAELRVPGSLAPGRYSLDATAFAGGRTLGSATFPAAVR